MKVLILDYLEKPYYEWNVRIPESKGLPRHWITTIDIEVQLSDGYILKISKGTVWDGASIPKWLWWLFSPIDKGAIGDLIHDILWMDKQKQFEFFDYNFFNARKFADEERYKWRKKLSPKTRIKNWITHKIIRLIGGFFYSKQLQIPN